MCEAIYFDLDGTIANLYGVENWEVRLNAHDATPYEIAEPMCNMALLNYLLGQIAAKGVVIGVVSWLAMNSNSDYDKAVRKAKREWIETYLPAATEIHIVKYGYSKKKAANIKNSILVDDNAEVRAAWRGETIDANGDIIAALRELLNRL